MGRPQRKRTTHTTPSTMGLRRCKVEGQRSTMVDTIVSTMVICEPKPSTISMKKKIIDQ